MGKALTTCTSKGGMFITGITGLSSGRKPSKAKSLFTSELANRQ
jgi:hypothetical protein